MTIMTAATTHAGLQAWVDEVFEEYPGSLDWGDRVYSWEKARFNGSTERDEGERWDEIEAEIEAKDWPNDEDEAVRAEEWDGIDRAALGAAAPAEGRDELDAQERARQAEKKRLAKVALARRSVRDVVRDLKGAWWPRPIPSHMADMVAPTIGRMRIAVEEAAAEQAAK